MLTPSLTDPAPSNTKFVTLKSGDALADVVASDDANGVAIGVTNITNSMTAIAVLPRLSRNATSSFRSFETIDIDLLTLFPPLGK